jgi:hypothetical protein
MSAGPPRRARDTSSFDLDAFADSVLIRSTRSEKTSEHTGFPGFQHGAHLCNGNTARHDVLAKGVIGSCPSQNLTESRRTPKSTTTLQLQPPQSILNHTTREIHAVIMAPLQAGDTFPDGVKFEYEIPSSTPLPRNCPADTTMRYSILKAWRLETV